MKKLCFLLLITAFIAYLPGFAQAASAEIAGAQGKAIQYKNDTGVWISETRLKTRTAGVWDDDPELNTLDANKSYLQFDLTAVYAANPGLQGNITNAKLRLWGANTETGAKEYVVSGLNDGVDETWNAATIDWFSAPGNDTASGSGLNASLTTPLYTGTVQPPCLDVLTETPEADQPAVTAFLNTDTDGLVTFILTAGQTAYLQNVGAAFEPVLVLEGDLDAPHSCPGLGISYVAYAEVSCRVEGGTTHQDANRHDSSKLSVRASSNGVKSWMRFNLTEFGIDDPNSLKSAWLRVTLHAPKGGPQACDVSVVNDDYRVNIGWAEREITWNNAPGNLTTDLGLLDASKTTWIQTISFTDGAAGQQFDIDVLSAIQADTDGIVQFVLHNSANLLDFATHDHPNGQEYWPRLDILQALPGADNPNPCPGAVVSTDLEKLSWSNPDPNDGVSPITCTVYFGLDPNRPQMDSVTLAADARTVLINTTNFPNYGTLQNLTPYYWTVDCDDPSAGMIAGMMWDFDVNNNEPPVVDAGPDQAVWLGKSGIPGQEVVYLDGTTSDDGLPLDPGEYTVLWEQVSGPTVTISPNDQDDTSVTVTERGEYVFRLTADDGDEDDQGVSSDTVRIAVGDDACDASHLFTGLPYDPGDVNEDCIVDMTDFAELIAANWLDCTDTIMNCGN